MRPTWDGLLIDPCLPPEWKRFRMTRRFRGSIYRIEVTSVRGPTTITVDGCPLEGQLLPEFHDDRVHSVDVRLGS